MKVPVSWLKNYAPVELPPTELARRLTMAGNEVGDVEILGAGWDSDKVVVGRTLSVDPHPNADRLRLVAVDAGGETATVVCGAPNVAPGQKIAFARAGATLINARSGKPEALKPANIRGVRSEGMVCSALELGLGDDHEGILVLDDDAPVGVPLAEHLGDAVLDIDVTPNRPDCLSVLGIAHEVAALTGAAVSEPEAAYAESEDAVESLASVRIDAPDLCPRYTASLMRGVRIGESPAWMQDALAKAGLRPINNIVDITNFVMLEYGQPLHAFDFGKVRDASIIVRAARPGETLVTLDGERRSLQPPMLVIADSRDAVGLAGVMGGANTEIDADTRDVLLESANFNAANTRRTRIALRMDSDASYRFERGLRPELAPIALRRATQLIAEIAGGVPAKGILDIYPNPAPAPSVRVSRQRVRQILGVDYTMDRIEGALASLGFERDRAPESLMPTMDAFASGAAASDDGVMWMRPPYWRSDIAIEEDIVEELARIIGYDSIPTTMLSAPIPHGQPQPARILRERVKDTLAGAGMRETISYPLVSAEMMDRMGEPRGDGDALRIANPMSSEFTHLRTSLRASVLNTLAYNLRVSRAQGIRIYEVGSVYLPRSEAKERDLPTERETLAGVVCGPRAPLSWHTPRQARSGEMGFFDAKGALEAVFADLRIDAHYEPCADDPLMQPGRAARVFCGSVPVGVIGELRPAVLARFDIDAPTVALFDVDLQALLALTPDDEFQYRPASRYPESYRDIALIADADASAARMQAIIERNKVVVSAAPFDIYAGEGVPTGKRSIAFRIVFQSDRATLSSEQIDRIQSGILRQLERELGAQLRA